jgi:hypothetical protein
MRRAAIVGLVIGGALLFATPPAAPATTTCSVQGPTLIIHETGSGFLHIGRSGDAIAVKEDISPPMVCGGQPTVVSIDAIRVTTDASASYGAPTVIVDLRNGPFAPGATDEGDGSSEIEMTIEGAGIVRVNGTPGTDSVRAGSTAQALGINLNADEATPDSDVAVTVPPFPTGPFSTQIRMVGFGSADLLSGNGGPGFSGPLGPPPLQYFQARGGHGDDRIVGTPRSDIISLGQGDDRARALGGNDFVAADQGVDTVDCGPGSRDDVFADKRDTVRGCERVR